MGKMVEKAARERGHEIIATIDNNDEWEEFLRSGDQADIAIEFSIPSVAVANIYKCLDAGIPLVTGTTGWQDDLAEVQERCQKSNGALLYASNFNIGVNILFELNRKLAELTEQHHAYKAKLTETHHVYKLDKPSGTAVSLAKDIIEERSDYSAFVVDSYAQENELPITCYREGEVKGIHEISYTGPFDHLRLLHEAKDRMGFAQGAIFAAEWLYGKSGCFEFREVLFGNTVQSGT